MICVPRLKTFQELFLGSHRNLPLSDQMNDGVPRQATILSIIIMHELVSNDETNSMSIAFVIIYIYIYIYKKEAPALRRSHTD